jgi:hypothetical protein
MIRFYDEVVADGGFYINMDHRADRKQKCEDQFKKFEITGMERMPGIVKGQYAGCGEAHKEIVRIAMSRGWKTVLIFEDDFYIMDPPSTGLGDHKVSYKDSMLAYLKQCKKIEWDVQFFGTILHAPLFRLGQNVGKIQSAKSAHAMVLRDTVFEDVLGWSYEKYDQLDHYYYTTLQKTKNFITSYPILINHGWPEGDVSDLLKRNITYHNYTISTYAEFAKAFHNQPADPV